MVLDTTTFLIVFTAAVVVMAGVIAVRYQIAKKNERR